MLDKIVKDFLDNYNKGLPISDDVDKMDNYIKTLINQPTIVQWADYLKPVLTLLYPHHSVHTNYNILNSSVVFSLALFQQNSTNKIGVIGINSVSQLPIQNLLSLTSEWSILIMDNQFIRDNLKLTQTMIQEIVKSPMSTMVFGTKIGKSGMFLRYP